jgi:cytochrome c
MKRLVLAAVASLALTGAAYAEDAYAPGDAEAGERIFKRCAACHAVGEGAKNKVGPQLNGIVGRAMGGVEGYKYSKPLVAKAEEVGEWDEEELFAYLADPGGFLGGRGKMAQKFPKADDRANVIAYLKGYAADGTTAE